LAPRSGDVDRVDMSVSVPSPDSGPWGEKIKLAWDQFIHCCICRNLDINKTSNK